MSVFYGCVVVFEPTLYYVLYYSHILAIKNSTMSCILQYAFHNAFQMICSWFITIFKNLQINTGNNLTNALPDLTMSACFPFLLPIRKTTAGIQARSPPSPHCPEAAWPASSWFCLSRLTACLGPTYNRDYSLGCF